MTSPRQETMAAVVTLTSLVENLADRELGRLDALGLLRLVEIQLGGVRQALVREVRSEGISWDRIADTLAISVDEVERRYA